MKVEIRKSFEKDIAKILDANLAMEILSRIEELENGSSLSEVHNLKKMKLKGDYFRMRIGNYRLGFKFEKDKLILLRFMHLKEIYKHFP